MENVDDVDVRPPLVSPPPQLLIHIQQGIGIITAKPSAGSVPHGGVGPWHGK